MGVLRLPWLQEEWRRHPNDDSVSHFKSCDGCKQEIPELARRMLACGYEPPMPGARGWDHPSRDEWPFEKDEPPVCPGYVCSLPEVMEVAEALTYKKDGELTQFCDGEVATPMLRRAITTLEQEGNRVLAWAMKNPPPKDA